MHPNRMRTGSIQPILPRAFASPYTDGLPYAAENATSSSPHTPSHSSDVSPCTHNQTVDLALRLLTCVPFPSPRAQISENADKLQARSPPPSPSIRRRCFPRSPPRRPRADGRDCDDAVRVPHSNLGALAHPAHTTPVASRLQGGACEDLPVALCAAAPPTCAPAACAALETTAACRIRLRLPLPAFADESILPLVKTQVESQVLTAATHSPRLR